MLVRNITPLKFRFRPFLLGQYFFSSFLLLCQAELQRSCQPASPPRGREHCQLSCHCRTYPPLPPPPPPPPPLRLLLPTVIEKPVVQPEPGWMEVIVLGTVGCASAVCLLLAVIICYKAIKRKPLRKEENGTSRGEYAMSSRNKKTKNVGINNSAV
ncbi:proline-rich membrane anchor 1-like [Chanos chanos]|uniref:Proline-rich membrane anchor 1-like n=1 Tax=Chanos chanos TaxID=29144 RepID=A0A6J2WQ56_CHACN|nr:proline-rich membrane anchor 1-like [Chanos chanos]